MKWITKRKEIAVASAVLALILIGWAWSALGGDPQLAKIRELQKQLRGEEAKNLDPEQRRELWGQLRQEIDQLSDEQREVLKKEREQAFAKQRQAKSKELGEFFKLSPEDQQAKLDETIDRAEERRKRWQGGGGWGGPGGRGWGRGAGTNQQGESTSQGESQDTGSEAAKPPPKAPWSSDPQERERRRKQFLDNTTADERAQFSEYFRMLRERRQQRGLTTGGLFGR